jgi:hypothetical protein
MVEGHLCKASGIVVQRALASPCKRSLLLHPSSTSGQVVCIMLLKALNLSAGLLDQILFFITWILNDEIMLLRSENYRRACHEVVITSWPAMK